jgi:hypothetical protein
MPFRCSSFQAVVRMAFSASREDSHPSRCAVLATPRPSHPRRLLASVSQGLPTTHAWSIPCVAQPT